MHRMIRRAAMCLLLFIAFGLVPPSASADENADVQAIASGLQSIGSRIGQLTGFDDIGAALPLSSLSLDGADGLDLANLLPASLGSALVALPGSATYADLQNAIAGASGTYGGVAVTFDDVLVSQNGGLVDVQFTLTAARTVSAPFSLSEGVVELSDGSFSLDLSLFTSLHFRFDANQAISNQAFYMVGAPALQFNAAAQGSLGTVSAQLGLTDVSLSGDVGVNAQIRAQLIDTDGNGRITLGDWQTTTNSDLFNVDLLDPAGPDVTASISVDSGLISGSPDASATFSDESLSDGFDIPSIDWGSLVDFSNLSPIDILNGLGQLVSSLGALEQLGSPDLPFLQGSFASVLDFAEPLLDFLRQQGDAAMVCGTQDSDPPLGSIRDLPANTPVYCQAVTFLGSSAVTWSIANGTVTTNGTATSTVGQNPTDNAEFLLTSAGTPDITLSFTDSNGGAHETALRFNTAQELITKLQELAGIDGAVSYDAATTALTFNLSKSFTAPSKDVDLNFGDQLRDATNLIGLSEGSGASASVGPSDLQFDVTFGAILDPDFDEDIADRFFIKVGTGADEYELSASTAVAATLDLEGRLGFLKVEASGDASANPDSSSAFLIEKVDDAKPMLGLNIVPPAGGISVPGRPAIADSIQLTTLLANTLNYLDVDVNVRMSAGLRVSASVGEPATELASGKVGIVWNDITSGTPTVTADGDFNEQLKSFDINPGVRGTHTGSANAATLTDSARTFTDIAGLNGSKLSNLTDGSDCTISSVGANTLSCTLSGGAENDWDAGDRYEVDANPLAMLSVILDKLEMLANLLDSLAGTDVGSYLTDDLPFVGVSPKELISQFAELLDVINQIRTGTPAAAQLRCGTNNTLPPTGSLKAVPDGATIYCQAVTRERKVHSATWSVSGGELQGEGYASIQPSATFRARSVDQQSQRARRAGGKQVFLPMVPGVAVQIDAVASVGQNPTANMAFVVDDGDRTTATTDASDFNVQVSFKGSNGVHVSSLNSSVIDSIPTSLQELETVIEDALGLPAQALAFEIADLPVPGSTTPDGVQDLVIRLGYGRCTSGNPDCTASSVQVPVLEFPIKLDLGTDNPDLIGVNSNSSIEVSYAATAQLDLAIPLKPSFDENSVVAVDTSGVVLSADIDTDDLNLSANVGPLTVNLGTTVDISSTADLQPGAGVAGLGARFTLRAASADATDNNQTYTIPGLISDLDASLDGPSVAKDCGSIDPDGDGGNDPIALTGDGCLRLSMGLNSTYLGDLGFIATDITDPDTWEVYVPDDLLDNIGSALLDWNLILQALPPLLDELQNSLEGGAADTKLPLIGDALDAGADIVGLINENIVTPLADLAAQLNEATDRDTDGDTDALDIVMLSQEEAFALLEPSGLIQDAPWAQDGTVDADDIRIIAKCGDATTDCVNGDPLFSIYDLRITFVIGQGISAGGAPVEGCDASCQATAGVPFDIGLDGLPLKAEGSITASVGWRLLVDFGLSRNEGPYIVVGGDGHDEPELSIGARAGLGSANGCDNELDPLETAPLPNGDPAPLGDFSADRCMSGQLGFLAINLRDGPDDDRTEVKLLSFLDVSADNDRLSFANFSGIDLDYGLEADANVNLRFRTGIAAGEKGDFPSILGQFRLGWEWSVGSNPSESEPTTLEFNHVHLDLGKFLTNYLGPIVKEVQRITKPLQPVIDTIRAPIPVLSDLSRLTGGGDITMIEVLEAVAGNDLTLIKRIIDLIDFVNRLPTEGNVLIPLSDLTNAFSVSPSVAKGGPLAPTQAGSLISNPHPRSNLLNDVQQSTSDWPSASGRPAGDGARVAAGSFMPDGLSFPFLNNATEIFGVLMGKDATLIRYDAGTLRAGTSINYTFGPIMVGPVPISIGLGGSIEVQGRFAIGYDTSGIRKVLSGGSGVHLFDGIFIDDLDSNGVDVPEISLIGTVSASAGVDLGIVAAGVEGGITLTVDLNLDDSPEPDGKLRIEEIFNKLQNPICLFVTSGKLEAFLGLFVRIGFSFLSKTFRLELARVTLLDFSYACEPPKPDLASVENGNLVLNMGPRADQRNISEDEEDESFMVRQLNAEGTTFSISAFGAYEEETISAGGKIIADAGSGDDSISLEAGTALDGTTLPFTARAEFQGGDGKDRFKTGGGNDDLNGGSGNDSINAGSGNDTVDGDGGDDILSGESGDDTLNGNDDSDTLLGGAGADTMDGGAGDDTLNGGPGSNTPTSEGNNPDLGDTLTGGDGNDDLDGGFGEDTLYGDEALACDAGGALNGFDTLSGGFGDDTLYGGAGNDTIGGDDGSDTLCGNAGNDTLLGDEVGSNTNLNVLNVSSTTARRMQAVATTAGDDTLFGGSGNDALSGHDGDDDLFGGAGDDTLSGDDGLDDLSGGANQDTLNGGEDRDYLFGDDGSATRPAGQNDASSVSFAEDTGAMDVLNGDGGADVLYGEGDDDQIFGGDDEDLGFGNGGLDVLRGNDGNDELYGNTGNDELYGDANDDELYGNEGDDLLHGGIDDDYLEGNQDSDELYGDAGQDDLIGGSSAAGTADSGDTLFGNGDHDVLIGDNGTITRPGDVNSFDGSVRRVTTLLDPTSGGADTLYGNEGNDRLFGVAMIDALFGQAGDDYLEGNHDGDFLYGGSDQDDLIGGTSAAGAADGADSLYGGDGLVNLDGDFDVIAGDNASIARPLSGGGWIADNFGDNANGVIRRSVSLFDVATTATTPDPSASAGDSLYGENSHDVLYGQGGDDGIYGGNGDDFAEGNAGDDTIVGNAGQDDLIGGTGRTTSDDAGSAADGRLDGADSIFGGNAGAELSGDFDAIAGDNATIIRPLAGGAWQYNSFNAAAQRTIRLYDVGVAAQAAAAGSFGGDELHGEGSDDVIYGQDGDDMMFGGGGDDYMEGNAASDTMTGQAGNDDMVGGTGRINDDPAAGSDGRRDGADTIHGDGDFDVIAGDNAVIDRVLSGGQWQPNGFNGGIQHERRILRDIDSADAALVSGGDTLYGDGEDDLIYGQGAGDEIFGGGGDDVIEGNAAGDTIRGEAGQDDIVGGTTEAALGDAGDWIDGGDDADIILGDNGTIERPLTGDRQWLRDTFASDAQDIVQRSIVLFDNTSTVGGSQPAATVSGGDALFGGSGRDRMFGQNNGAQPATQLDAPDGADNDLDGQTDEDAPWLGDEMYGGDGDDYMEGNAGADWMSGDAGQDDIIGGYSVRNGVIDSNAEPINMVDGSDILRGNAGDDVLLGDNARVVRPLDGSGLWRRIVGGTAGLDMVVRETSMPTNAQQQGVFGDDFMLGNDGHDDMYGQAGDDYMEGNTGQDALVGDLGLITNRLEDGSRQRVIATKQPFLEETIFAQGSLSRLVELYAQTDPNPVAGADIMLGGDNRDALHGGGGADLINGDGDGDIAGTTDQDSVFGGDGDDALWGGRSSDHVWGGHGADHLDVKPRAQDPATWHQYAGADNYQDMDILYGGWDQDALQANVGGPGPQPGDRLLDWAGAYNVYYTCPAAYGEGVITRSIAPSVIKFLQDLAEGDGADRPSVQPASGFREIAIVFNRDIRFNSNPPHPDHPGHFTCN